MFLLANLSSNTVSTNTLHSALCGLIIQRSSFPDLELVMRSTVTVAILFASTLAKWCDDVEWIPIESQVEVTSSTTTTVAKNARQINNFSPFRRRRAASSSSSRLAKRWTYLNSLPGLLRMTMVEGNYRAKRQLIGLTAIRDQCTLWYR